MARVSSQTSVRKYFCRSARCASVRWSAEVFTMSRTFCGRESGERSAFDVVYDSFTTPRVVTGVVGVDRDIGAATQVFNGRNFQFSHWSDGGSATHTVATPANNTSTSAGEDAPVDMERILDFTEGSLDSLKELVTLYLDQTSGQMEQLEAAVQAGNAQDVRRLAHTCAGASATCGMRRLVPMLRELEKQGFEGKLTTARELCAASAKEFEVIRAFLEDYISKQSPVASQA